MINSIVLMYMFEQGSTNRNKETACSICALEEVWEQLQPSVVAIHDELPVAILGLFRAHLRKPCILCRESGGRV